MNHVADSTHDVTDVLRDQTQQLLNGVVDQARHPIEQNAYRDECKRKLDEQGALVLSDFLTPGAVAQIAREGDLYRHLAYYTVNDHNVYLKPAAPEFAESHPRNRLVSSSKGCITADQIPTSSSLHTLYDNNRFRAFLCAVLNEHALHEYADPLSSINLHYASHGQELGGIEIIMCT